MIRASVAGVGVLAVLTGCADQILESLIDRGARADVLIAVSSAVQRLAGRGVTEAATLRPLARVGVGVAVPKGHAHPPLGDEAALRDALLRARSVAYSRSGVSGHHVNDLLDRLDIRDEVESHATIVDRGFTADALLDGRADLAIQQLSELNYIDGVDVVGPLPEPVQHYTEFSAALYTKPQTDDAISLHDALTTTTAQQAYQRTGLLPLEGPWV